MSTTISPATSSSLFPAEVQSRSGRSVWLVGLAAGVSAAVANVVVAAVAEAFDVSLKVASSGGKPPAPVPLGGFATMTLLGAAIGILIAYGSARWAKRPRSRFVAITSVATAATLVAPLLGASDAATILVLCLTHVLGAVIVVRALAARLPQTV
jgi:Family of unknown function (DUF6069)